MREVNIRIPRWIAELSEDHQLKQSYRAAIEDVVDRIHIVRDVSSAAAALANTTTFGPTGSMKSILETGQRLLA